MKGYEIAGSMKGQGGGYLVLTSRLLMKPRSKVMGCVTHYLETN